MSLNNAGALMRDFWISYMFGMWASSFILCFFDLQRILTVLVGIAAVLMYLFNRHAGTYTVVYSDTGLLLQRHLYLHHYAGIAANESGLAEADQLQF